MTRLPAPARHALRAAKREARALALTGRAVECPVCRGRFRHFAAVPGAGRILCPRCWSLQRQRRTALILRRATNLYDDRLRVLHIAPELGLRRELQRLPNLEYVTADLHAEGVAIRMDITSIDLPDETFDVILCSHVLEHVPDDRRAMRELRRVLKRDGWALLNVPTEPGRRDIFEDPSIVTASERLKHFGQEDHVRIYSTEGFLSRLHDAGFQVTIDPVPFATEERARYGLDDDGWDHSYLCRRAPE